MSNNTYKLFILKFCNDTLIKPGTNFLLNKNSNIIFKNKVEAAGTKDNKITFKDCGYKFIDKQIFKNVKKRYNKLEEFIYFDYLKKNKVSYFLVKEKPLCLRIRWAGSDRQPAENTSPQSADLLKSPRTNLGKKLYFHEK